MDAATLFADSMMVLRPWQLWSSDGKPAEGTPEIVATLERVLARQPDHIGANHLYIHAIEASPEPLKGLPSAKRLEKLAPAAGHLVHMPAHIYDRIGNYPAAAQANAIGAAADRAYIKRGGGGMYPLMYYSHNLHFLAIVNAMRGRQQEALAAANQLVRHVTPALKDAPMLEGFLPTPLLINVRFQKWNAVLKTRQPPEAHPASTALWHFARGMAFAARTDVAAAKAERAQLADAAARIPKEVAWGNNKPGDLVGVAGALLDAEIALAGNDPKAAMTAYADAAKAEDALAYDEPQPWPLPVRERWGMALLATGEAAAAEGVFRDELAKRPYSGRALFGLSAALKGQNKPTLEVDRNVEVAWKDADTKLVLPKKR
jgi:hypothetical protein